LSLRPQPSRKVIKALSSLGFEAARTHGSHVVMKHADGRITVIPAHAKENIGVGLLLKIMKDAKLEREEFVKLLAKP
jgi:predicted RNA binding protein YcfA (HicA-like mRNA interferase family)